MRDCGNAEMRDQLPDLLDDAPGRAELAGVRAHVAECASCRDELAFLRQVRGAARVPRLDVPRIAAAIPPYRAAPAWRRLSRSPVARIAAGGILLFGVALAQQLVKKDRVLVDTLAVATNVAAPAELSPGTLTDISDSDLQGLLEDLGDIEAVTPAEEEVIVLPALEGNGE